MRNLYSLFFTALLSCISIAANAINITVNVDDPSRVSVTTSYSSTPLELVAGDNAVSVDEYTQIYVRAKENVFINEVVRSKDGEDDKKQDQYSMTEVYFYVYSTDEGAKYTVSSANADDLRDGSCTIWVDDPTNVRVQRSGTYTDVDIVAGETTVKYIKDKELPLMIGAKNYGTELYQVKVNDEVVSPQGNMWYVTPADGAKVEIFANFPDEDVAVEFKYASEEAKGFITGVTVNGETVENYNDADFKVKVGSQISISGNITDYKLNSFKVNGNEPYFYSPYSFTVKEATIIEVDAHKYGTVKATLDIDNPDNVVVYKGYSYENNIITLNPGENEIELSETNALIQIKAVSGSYITSVTADEMSISADYESKYNVNVTEGMKIVVKSGTIDRNKTAVIYIDDLSKAPYGNSLNRADNSNIDLVNGYNEIKFYDGDNPFRLSFYGVESATAYKNNETFSGVYGGASYELSLTDGDVIKIFLASNPEMLEAELTAGDGVDASKVAVTMDRIVTVTDWAGKHNTLPGTEISIKPAEDYDICVAVDGENVTADADGAFTVIVSKNTTIAVSLPVETGINAVDAEKLDNAGVYNMQGVRVGNADMKQLPAGVYIINGKKVVKR
ncbi:MAG: hypothetical protein IJY03_02005 [Prevotella sp.]|nr:hypothetical protein [Prevotella sp.]